MAPATLMVWGFLFENRSSSSTSLCFSLLWMFCGFFFLLLTFLFNLNLYYKLLTVWAEKVHIFFLIHLKKKPELKKNPLSHNDH